jgi:predicted alpha/beta superfamily hydrolase
MQTLKERRIRLLMMLLACLVLSKLNSDWVLASISDGVTPITRVHTLTGDIRIHPNFHSKFLPTDREIAIYLPPGYDADKTKRYPVLYLQDGQNVFDEATCFSPGTERHFDERAQALIQDGAIQPLIIVGIYSTELDRMTEYTPTKQRGSFRGGDADLYGRMLVEEIKPFVDSAYRTLTSRENTGVGGSSLGGLVSVYLGIKYKEVFSKLAVTSPAAFWDDEMIVRYINGLQTKTDQKIFLSVGAGEPDHFLVSTRALHEALRSKGWEENANLEYYEPQIAAHRPGAWTPGIDFQLKFLFPPKVLDRSR